MIRNYLLAVLCLLGVIASAHDIEVPNADGVTIYYNYINDNTELAVTFAGVWYGHYNNEYRGVVVIPEEVALEERTLKVTCIEISAFDGCHELTSITIPNSVTSIGDCAFLGCRSLTSVIIPDGITSIGKFTFNGCLSLTSVTIPNSVTDIGKYAFDGCSALTSISIPQSVTNIGESAFYGCTSLTSFTIPNSVTSIEDYTFAGCINLTSITIGNSVASIGKNAFTGCRSLTSVTIPNSVTSIGDYTFSRCYGLTSIDIGNGVTIIGNDAFWECTNLTSVTMGNSVTSIGDLAFNDCTSLKSITIPSSVTHIGNNVFYYCNKLKAIHISDLAAWCNIQFDGAFFSRYHLYLNGKEITNLTIPESVTSVSNYAFAKCHRLLSITIPEGLTCIGNYVFQECLNLQNIYCHAEQVPETGNNAFEKSNYNAILHVPIASIGTYQAVEPWKNFGNIVALPAQDDYRPFIEDNKVWKVGNASTGNPVQLVEYYYFDGDTIIDGKTCKQMMCQRFANPEYLEYAIISQNPLSYVGAWYEEDKKVYAYNETNKQFKLMYDFSHDANVTLQINDRSYVIGSKQMGGVEGFKGVYRDVEMLTDAGNTILSTPWLEGVGGIYGPTTNVIDGELADPAWFMMACYVGDEVIYLNDEYEDEATPEAMNARRRFDFTHTVKTQPKIPMRREAELSLSGEYNNLQLSINLDPLYDTYLVSITDETGKEVYEKAIEAGNIVALNIDISAYPEGCYTVTVENSCESFIGEFETQTTGIGEVRNEKEVPSNHIYNLQGQRISSLQKGLNIVNGQKIYVKRQ